MFHSSGGRKWTSVLFFSCILSTTIIGLLSLHFRDEITSWRIALSSSVPSSCVAQHDTLNSPSTAHPNHIPNTVHFVYVYPNTSADLSFQFKHYLSFYSAWHHWRPETIYFHTNFDDASLERARSGQTTKWSQLMLSHPAVRINKVSMKTHAGNGKKLENMQHASDFARVAAVAPLGGTYIDFDVYALRDIRPLRESGFAGIAGRQIDGNVNSGEFMGRPGCRMLTEWHERMNQVYDGGWTTHSNNALMDIAERLAGEPGEALIMETKAFAPRGWSNDDIRALFVTHEDVPNHLRDVRFRDNDGRSLYPELPPVLADEKNGAKRPEWQHDYSPSYMVHAWLPSKERNGIVDLRALTPRYVLERQSDFARALYPAVKAMYDEGLLSADDLEE